MFEHRIIRTNIGDKISFTIKKVEFDNDGNPVKIIEDSGKIEATNTQELMILLIDFISTLTKPVVDSALFTKDNVPAHKKAMEIMKNV